MGPKRRYQCSTVLGGIPPQPRTSSPPEYFSNLTYSYSQPITSAQIAVNPCLSSKKITSTPNHPPQKANPSSSASKGNRTYRVKHHHQNHYELPVVHPPPTPGGGAGDSSRPTTATNMALSQGIFGLPVMQEYFACSPDDYLENQRPPPSSPPKQRMRSTLPSSSTAAKSSILTEPVTNSHHEDMDGILQVRPASRSRTRPELNGGGGLMRRSQGGGGAGGRRRAQSSTGFIPESVLKLFPEEENEEPHHHHQQHLPKPSGDLCEAILGKLKSQDADWEEILDGFQMVNRWVSSSSKWPAGFLKKVIWAGLPHLGSQRTKLSRAACQCFKVLYEMGKGGGGASEGMGIGDGDRVFQRLLDLCGGTANKFIREESKGALLAAAENLEPGKVLGLLEQFGCKHRNAQVKEYAAYLLGKVVDRVGMERVVGGKEYAQRVLPMIVGFLMEGQLQTRIHAKACLSKIYSHPEFQTKLRRYVPSNNIRTVQETLKKMQSGGGGGGGGGGGPSGSSSQQMIHQRRPSTKWS